MEFIPNNKFINKLIYCKNNGTYETKPFWFHVASIDDDNYCLIGNEICIDSNNYIFIGNTLYITHIYCNYKYIIDINCIRDWKYDIINTLSSIFPSTVVNNLCDSILTDNYKNILYDIFTKNFIKNNSININNIPTNTYCIYIKKLKLFDSKQLNDEIFKQSIHFHETTYIIYCNVGETYCCGIYDNLQKVKNCINKLKESDSYKNKIIDIFYEKVNKSIYDNYYYIINNYYDINSIIINNNSIIINKKKIVYMNWYYPQSINTNNKRLNNKEFLKHYNNITLRNALYSILM